MSEPLAEEEQRSLSAVASSGSYVARSLDECDALRSASAHDREFLGRLVRKVWIDWAREQPSPKPSWLVPWDGLSEPDREVDRRIGEQVASVATALMQREVERLEVAVATERAAREKAEADAAHWLIRAQEAQGERDVALARMVETGRETR